MTDDIPDPPSIARHCELAPIAALEFALALAVNALNAAHPELWLEDERGPMDHLVPRQVNQLLDLIHRLQPAIRRYRTDLDVNDRELPLDDNSEIPF